MFPEDAQDPNGLLRNADAAMYRAKDQGKNAFHFFTETLARQANQRLDLESGLRRAIERSELLLEYQPQVNLETDAVVGVEALLRWHDGSKFVSPSEFIPIAEESHLIVAIDEWVLSEVQADRCGTRFPHRISVSCAIS
jgi:predicted signal transduction protein with EAL and GGDEF domain